ncbi:NADase-type glycan-binding domain-containing protein [Aureispira anguillae]|uniref:NAD glycohydrolase translocation F5/8 type C domain-containing protein n=1 Tax=Aureispira anguillae TaxID=2864201 RepID=A0A916DNW8_9BACT|nr:hypothetical protein [Aureispira anguillae]BDS09816.1 hypothetical protein AsAng_0005210 [Aureispira anguillae]
MNFKLILSALLVTNVWMTAKAQLPVVQAKGGEGIAIDWNTMAEKGTAEDGLGFFHNPCAQGTTPMHVSSTLKGQGSKTYKLQNLADDNPMTAWVEGVLGYGIGEWFEVKAITVNRIYNGYQSSAKNWKDNSRVKRFKVYLDGAPICFLDLTDEMGAQHFELPHRPNWETKANFKFEIVEVYKGDKWDDVCISHVDHVACCFAPTTQISLANNWSQAINTIKEGTPLLGIDLNTATTFESNVQLTTNQRHLTLLEVATASHEIAITPDHPLYIEGRGFISLGQLMVDQNYKDWDALEQAELNVMVYDKALGKTKFEKINTIKKIEGDFDTYTILSIAKGSTYIANGFVNKVY